MNFDFFFSASFASSASKRVFDDSISCLSVLTSLSSAVAFDSVSFLSSSIFIKRFFFSADALASNSLSFSTVS